MTSESTTYEKHMAIQDDARKMVRIMLEALRVRGYVVINRRLEDMVETLFVTHLMTESET